MNAPQPRTAASASASSAVPSGTTSATPSAAPATPPVASPAVSATRRKPALIGLMALLLLGGAAYAIYWALYLRHYESTDNAYVQAPVVLITPQVGGTVTEILVDDTDIVKAGQPLVRLDPADAQLAYERAQAQLAQTLREVRTLYANNGALESNVQLRDAEIARAQADVARAAEDLNRRRPLVASGAVSGEELKHAETALLSAQSALAGARSARNAATGQVGSSRALTEGTTVENHPNVQRAQAALHEAALALERTELRAPTAGQIARRTVQVGQRIQSGAPLMTVIPLDQVWVEANFKEVQLRKMRIGQHVELSADLYGDKIRYDGTIVGLGAGTGSAFALLPAQNATGNWIKVVQRVPVRVKLDAAQLAQHPLRVGLSMEATVDVADASGARVAPGVAAPASGSAATVGSIGENTAAANTANTANTASITTSTSTSTSPGTAMSGNITGNKPGPTDPGAARAAPAVAQR